jgi:tRNA G46 methylase TrmB
MCYRNASIGNALTPTPSPTITSNSEARKSCSTCRHVCKRADEVILRSPPSPEYMDWSKHYPEHFTASAEGSGCVSTTGKKVEWVDIGCGFGGLTCALAPLFPDELILGKKGISVCNVIL